ncbi:MAG: AbrB family transcriptional regulator, partial [Rubrobacter sp.]
MLFWLMASWLLVRFSGYDLSTSALASTPGGISGVIPAAEETDADAVIVTFMHLVRLSTVVVVVPILVTVFFGR